MELRRLGKAGLKVSELSFGSWITFGENLDIHGVKSCIKEAFDRGINFFDNAEVYAGGMSEMLMGEALKSFRREDLVVSTKLFWGGQGPNDTGLSWKHLMEGMKNSLKRLQLDYVDLVFCHRPDPDTPIEETVRAMDVIVRSGYAFYWGTSEWSAEQLEEAYSKAKAFHAIPPTMEQPEYNMFKRDRFEKEYAPIFKKYQMGTTTWSPLDCGILTGKYRRGIPKGSRLDRHEELRQRLTDDKVNKVEALKEVASDLGCTMPQLAIAWCLKNPHVSTVIIGASHIGQLRENLQAVDVKAQLTKDVMKKIDKILMS